ncbi:MAG: hypothetical protein FWC11_05180 [Firmicutes bacterium]|nr:hypothetical protein [Bacillota bacterium]
MSTVFNSFVGNCYYMEQSQQKHRKSLTRVFDPFDGKCKCTQNPTEQSKTVDKGFQLICERLPLLKILRQMHRKSLTRVFDPLDGECQIYAEPDKAVENC